MMKIRTLILLLSVCCIVLISCKDDDEKRSSEKKIIEFSINAIFGTIDEEDKTIELILPSGTDVTSLAPIIKVSDNASINPSSSVVVNFSQAVVYTVTAEDGTKQAYTIQVIVENLKSSEKKIIEFSINDIKGTIEEENKAIKLTLPFDTDITKLKPIIKISDLTTVEPASNELVNLSSPVTYTVTAEDGSKQEYTVHADLDIKIISLYNNVAVPGGRFLIFGENFLKSGNVVSFEETTYGNLKVLYENQNRVYVQPPEDIAPGEYTIKLSCGDKNTVYQSARVKILPPSIAPKISSLSKSTIIRGEDSLVVTGVNLGLTKMISLQRKDNPGGTHLIQGRISDNIIIFDIPQFSSLFFGEYNLWTSNNGINTNIVELTIEGGPNSAPSISNIASQDLSNICRARSLSVVGSNFQPDATVRFIKNDNLSVPAEVGHIYPNKIDIKTTNLELGAYKRVEVSTNGKSISYNVNFEVTQCPTPEYISITPQQGVRKANVKLIGKHFSSIGIGEDISIRFMLPSNISSTTYARIISDTEASLQVFPPATEEYGELDLQIVDKWDMQHVYRSFKFTILEE